MLAISGVRSPHLYSKSKELGIRSSDLYMFNIHFFYSMCDSYLDLTYQHISPSIFVIHVQLHHIWHSTSTKHEACPRLVLKRGATIFSQTINMGGDMGTSYWTKNNHTNRVGHIFIQNLNVLDIESTCYSLKKLDFYFIFLKMFFLWKLTQKW